MKLEESHARSLVTRALAGEADALEAIVVAIQDDVFNLTLRMLGGRAEAEDATQEIVIQVLTHLGQWRAEASLRTWVWKIAVRHALRVKKSRFEEECSFEVIEGLIEAGQANPPLPALAEAELVVLEEELRLACTEAMLLSLDRDHRIAWLLAEVFDLASEEAASAVGVEGATYRKRVSRARERISAWMASNCGLVDTGNLCRCRRQIPVGMEFGAVDPNNLQFAGRAQVRDPRRRRLNVLADSADEVERAAAALCCHPEYAAPDATLAKVKELIANRSLRLFDA